MRRSDYIVLLADNKLTEHILPVFDVLETYVDYDGEYTADMLNEISTLLCDEEIKKHISAMAKEASGRGFNILRSYLKSLNSNIRGYIAMNDRDVSTRRVKLEKILCSYINVSRLIIDYEVIAQMVGRLPQENEKIVLAFGLTKIEEDKARINAEIDNLVELSRQAPNCYVIPAYGCTSNQFESMMRDTGANIIHVAGHGYKTGNGKIVISFVDENMTFSRFCAKIPNNRQKELICLNCCNSYEYVKKNAISQANDSIVHEAPVDGEIAYNFSDSFYRTLFSTGDLEQAWDTAKHQETPLRYHLLRSENI